LDVRPEAGYFVGIKLTQDTAIGVLTDFKASDLAHLELRLTGRDVDSVVAVVAELYQKLREQLPSQQSVTAVGVSFGGFIKDNRAVVYAEYLGWENVDLLTPLERVLGVPTYLESDVVAVTAAEHWFGEGRGVSDFAVLTLGAGVGYGLVRRDHVVNTPDARMGLVGHVRLDASPQTCSMGHSGCATALMSIPSMVAAASYRMGRDVSYEELLNLADDANEIASDIVWRAAQAFAHLIALVSNIALVETIVLGGEGLGPFVRHRAEIERLVLELRTPHAAEVTILLGDSTFVSWARGAAAVAIQESFERMLA
jgi:predicted NBD/HSP70 family sugar kinase